MTERVGLIGLGNAGIALATPIARKYEVVGYDLDPARRELASAIDGASQQEPGEIRACDEEHQTSGRLQDADNRRRDGFAKGVGEWFDHDLTIAVVTRIGIG